MAAKGTAWRRTLRHTQERGCCNGLVMSAGSSKEDIAHVPPFGISEKMISEAPDCFCTSWFYIRGTKHSKTSLIWTTLGTTQVIEKVVI